MVEAVHIPFTKLKRSDKNKWLNDAMRIICADTNQEHINRNLDKTETNELHRSWLDVRLLSGLFPFSLFCSNFSFFNFVVLAVLYPQVQRRGKPNGVV